MVRRSNRLICPDTSRRSADGHSSRGNACNSARNLPVSGLPWPVEPNASAKRLRCAKEVSQGVPVIGA